MLNQKASIWIYDRSMINGAVHTYNIFNMQYYIFTNNDYDSCIIRVIEGFQDRGGLKEFLFALPRFAKDEVRVEYHYMTIILPPPSCCLHAL